MKRQHSMIVVGCAAVAAVVIGVALYIAPTRSADAATFARPNFEKARPDNYLDLSRFSALARKADLRRLSRNTEACHDALDLADVKYTAMQPIRTGQGCGVEDAVVLDKSLIFQKVGEPLEMTCAMAARYYLWQTQIVAPAAEKYFGSPLVGVEALGAYSCRTIAGETKMSEHAFGKAADISGFRLADGRTITVLHDYYSKGPEGAFLREIHGKACSLFDVTLGPDYNADHANHFHLDVGMDHACH
jgi:hypothetical protein